MVISFVQWTAFFERLHDHLAGSHAGDSSVEFRRGLSELHASGSGSVETLFTKHLLEELGHDVRPELRTDNQGARSVVLLQRLRKMKHIEFRIFFAQEVTKR